MVAIIVPMLFGECLCEYVCTCTLLFSGDDDSGARCLPVLLQRHIQAEQVLCILEGGQKGELTITSSVNSFTQGQIYIHEFTR